MILELDVGNTRIKWRQVEHASSALAAEGHVPGFNELILLPELSQPVEMVRMCSVRSGDFNHKFRAWVKEKYSLDLQFAEVSQSCGGVSNQYTDLSRLGVDRWLAMLAAYRRAGGACIVVDAGTAFTIDVVDAGGLHLGGYIIPGLELMRSSIEQNTAIRLDPDYSLMSESLGHSTEEAVFNGTLAALVAAINMQVDFVRGELNWCGKVYFSGGDAGLLHKHAAIPESEIVPSLVFDGLSIACPFSESPQPTSSATRNKQGD